MTRSLKKVCLLLYAWATNVANNIMGPSGHCVTGAKLQEKPKVAKSKKVKLGYIIVQSKA